MSCCARDAGKTISHGHKVITSEPLSPLEERPVVREAELELDSLDLVGAVQHGAYHRVVKLLESGHGHSAHQGLYAPSLLSSFENSTQWFSLYVDPKSRSL